MLYKQDTGCIIGRKNSFLKTTNILLELTISTLTRMKIPLISILHYCYIPVTYSPNSLSNSTTYPPPNSLFSSATYLNTMDIGLPTSSPSGVNFMPSSPPSGGVECWPDDLNSQFIEMVLKNKGNCLLALAKCSDYQYYLNNRMAVSQATDRVERWHQTHNKHWASTFFELQDNQVYR